MYKWLIAGCAIGFGLGLIFSNTLFEAALSPFGNPLTVDYTTWDWASQTNNWRLIGILWVICGTVALYPLYRAQKHTRNVQLEAKKLRKKIETLESLLGRIEELENRLPHVRRT